MDLLVKPSIVSGSVIAPPSKSYTHRALFTALPSNDSVLKNPLFSDDTLATMSAVEAMGARISKSGDGGHGVDVQVNGTCGNLQQPAEPIDVANSGTTLRFAAASCALLSGETVLTGDESLNRRPNAPLLEALVQLGAEACSIEGDGTAPIKIRGPMKGGRSTLFGGISSQYLSALLLACPLCHEPVEIEVEGVLRSAPYVEMTLEVLQAAGVSWKKEGNVYSTHPGQIFNLKEFEVPGDFSSAAYILSAAAITGGDVTVSGMASTTQADAAILEIINRMGCRVFTDESRERVTVRGGELSSIDIDASDFPDLVPTIAVLAAHANGVTRIENVEHARHKESDRLSCTAGQLRRMGINVREGRDFLEIEGGKPRGATLDSGGDHRLAMAFTVAAIGANGPSKIRGAECISVSYARFIDDMRDIGAEVDVVA